MNADLLKLKPCPFCSGGVTRWQSNGIGDKWLECADCGASTRLREDGAGSEKDWNRRATDTQALLDRIRDLELDRRRLDFLIDQRVWVQPTLRDGSIQQYQVYDQDEDENYIVRSGENRYFNTPREAIDAALSAKKEST